MREVKVTKTKLVKYGDTKGCRCKPEDAIAMIELYMSAKLGYSAIRHILGLKTDHLIEDVIRQHKLGRKDVKPLEGQLFCPASKQIDAEGISIIRKYTHKYGTFEDPYVIEMLATQSWYDDPVKSELKCINCGHLLERDWKVCPYCATCVEE